MSVRALDLVLGEPWAITPEGMNQVLAIAQRANESPEAVSARLGRPLDNTRSVTVRDGVALIPVTGPIFRRANLFTELSGATSVEVLARDIQTALDDGKVEALVLEADSPGGQAAGISELAQLIHAAEKPVFVHTDGQAASAMYWLAAAAGRLTLSASAMLGSIGVVLSYRPEKDAPIEIVSSQSPAKRATPESEAGRAELQRLVDDLAAVFVADVARFRGVSEERVLNDFGRGGMLVGQKAVAVGMADEVTTLERILAGRRLNSRSVFTMGASAPANGDDTMSLIPEAVCTALGIPADASADTAVAAINGLKTSASETIQAKGAEARAAGAAAERERIFGILDHEAAAGRLDVAVKIAKTEAMTPETAGPLLESLPKAEPKAQESVDPLAAHMKRLGNPPVHGDDQGEEDPGAMTAKVWDRALASRGIKVQ